MNHLTTLASALSLAALVPAQSASTSLDIDVQPRSVVFTVSGPSEPFLGGVLLSLSPDLMHFLVDLPPLLADSVVLGVAVGQDEIPFSMDITALPPGVEIYAQSVIAFDAIYSSPVGSVVVDLTVP